MKYIKLFDQYLDQAFQVEITDAGADSVRRSALRHPEISDMPFPDTPFQSRVKNEISAYSGWWEKAT